MTLMSQPLWIWSEVYDFPRMNSMNDLARKEIQSVFNYDANIEYAENLKLKKPNFEKDSLKSICNENVNFTNYCKMMQSLPDLQLTMHLMNLAMSPLSFDGRDVKGRLRYVKGC